MSSRHRSGRLNACGRCPNPNLRRHHVMNPSGTERTRRRVSMSDRRWAIILHGGAKEIAPKEQEAHREGVRAALTAGIAVLQRGGTAVEAVEAVEAAIRVLEDNPTFNAGHGSALN